MTDTDTVLPEIRQCPEEFAPTDKGVPCTCCDGQHTARLYRHKPAEPKPVHPGERMPIHATNEQQDREIQHHLADCPVCGFCVRPKRLGD